MIAINGDGTRAIISINSLANMCGYFYNSEAEGDCAFCPNNGYNCKHPECQTKEEGIGCCYAWGCPLGWEADEEDCGEFGVDYEESEFVVTENQKILEQLKREL